MKSSICRISMEIKSNRKTHISHWKKLRPTLSSSNIIIFQQFVFQDGSDKKRAPFPRGWWVVATHNTKLNKVYYVVRNAWLTISNLNTLFRNPPRFSETQLNSIKALRFRFYFHFYLFIFVDYLSDSSKWIFVAVQAYLSIKINGW